MNFISKLLLVWNVIWTILDNSYDEIRKKCIMLYAQRVSQMTEISFEMATEIHDNFQMQYDISVSEQLLICNNFDRKSLRWRLSLLFSFGLQIKIYGKNGAKIECKEQHIQL